MTESFLWTDSKDSIHWDESKSPPTTILFGQVDSARFYIGTLSVAHNKKGISGIVDLKHSLSDRWRLATAANWNNPFAIGRRGRISHDWLHIRCRGTQLEHAWNGKHWLPIQGPTDPTSWALSPFVFFCSEPVQFALPPLSLLFLY